MSALSAELPIAESSSTSVQMEAIATLQRLADLFAERRTQLAREVGLTVEQWRLLEEVSVEHFMPSMFAKSRDCSPAAVSKVLRQLLERELIEVSVARDGGGDARRRNYRLTADGQRTMRRLRESRQRAIDAVWGNLDVEGLAHFAAFGGELIQRLEDYAAREGA